MEFCLNAAPGQGISEPITAGQSATFNLEIDSSAGFAGTVQLGCTNPPPAGTCMATPGSVQVSPGTSGPFQVAVTTTARGAATIPAAVRDREPPGFEELGLSVLGLALVLVVCVVGAVVTLRADSRGRRQPIRLVAAELAGLVLALAMMACGGSGGGPGRSGCGDAGGDVHGDGDGVGGRVGAGECSEDVADHDYGAVNPRPLAPGGWLTSSKFAGISWPYE